MAFRVEHIRAALGSSLAQFWMSDRSRRRLVTCVTCMNDLSEAGQCMAGEIIVLPGNCRAVERASELAAIGRHERISGIIVTASSVKPEGERRLRELAIDGDVAIGILTPDIDGQSAANILSRALASSPGDTMLSRLHTAETLQELAETLGRLVGNSVTIETPTHELLASSPTGSDVDRNREETILHRRGTGKIMKHPDFERYMARVRSSDWPQHIKAYPEIGFAGRVAMRIATDGDTFGVIWVTDTARPLGEGDYAAIKQAADAAAAIFARQRAASLREATLRAELLDDVIHGRITRRENIRTAALTIGWNIDRFQQALIVAIDDFEDFRMRHTGRTGTRLQRAREPLVELVKLEVLAVDPEAVVGLRSSAAVVLLDVGQEHESERKVVALRLAQIIVRSVRTFLGGMTVTVGVGRSVRSFEQMADSFRQAELAVKLGQTLWGGNRALHYDDLGIHRALFALREDEGMMTPALQRVVDHDAEHNTDYVRTLSVFLKNMGRLRPAAAELGIHRNTLEYRIARIAELAGLDLNDPDSRLAIELGIRLLELRGETQPLERGGADVPPSI